MLHLIRFRLNGLATRLEERDAIRRLQRLDDRMLADMGIQRSQIHSAVRFQTTSNPL